MLTKVRLARALKAFRQANALSQAQLASDAGIMRETVVQIEGGKSNPRVSTLEALAYTLGIDISELFKPYEYGKTPETFA